ncbi:MAG: PAS domain S-box protein, partial [Chloroflexi bacterium]|nr:PAS domain S-box protein [Chloroflexota bacterium]
MMNPGSLRNGGASPIQFNDRTALGWAKWVGAAALLSFLALVFLSRTAEIGFVYYTPLLFSALNIVFVVVISLVVAFLAARSVLITGQRLSWLGGGALAFGLSGLFSALVQGQLNASVAAHNLGALLAGFLYLGSATTILRGRPLVRLPGTPSRVLIGVYGAVVLVMALIVIFSLSGLMPTFFTLETGSTPLRQVVLGAADALFVISGLLLLTAWTRSRASFLYWYSLGLILTALGLFALNFIRIPGDTFAWLGRIGQYVGSVYLLIAVATVVKEARSRHMPVEEVIAAFGKQAEFNYKLLVNSASDAIIGIDGLGRIFAFNPAAEKMFGYARSEAIGKPFFDLIFSPGQVDAYQKAAGAVDAGSDSDERSSAIDLTARRKNGEEFPVELTLISSRLMAGWLPTTTTTTTLVIRDITERKKAEEAVRESERRLAEAQQTVHLGSWEWDLQTGEMHWSDEMFRIVGVAPQSFTPTLETATERMHPDDRQKVQAQLDELWAKGTASYEHHVVLPDGTVRNVVTNSIVTYDKSGKPKSVAGTLQDITERKKTEEALRANETQLRLILDQLPCNVWTVDRDLKITSVQGEIIRSEARREADIIGKPIHEYLQLRNLDSAPILACLRALAGERSSYENESGGKTYVTYVEPLRDEKDVISGAIAIGIDITERKKTERLKDEFIGMVSHELRTPLTVIMGALHVLTAAGL